MDTRALKTFCAVYENGGFNKAAKQLFMTPQGISKTISRMEDTLNCSLFIRLPHGIIPTQHAHDLYPLARSICDETQMIIDGTYSTIPYQLYISACYCTLSCLGPSFFSTFLHNSPFIDVNINEFGDDDALYELRSGHSDIATCSGPIDLYHYIYYPLYHHKYSLFVNSKDVIANKKTAQLNDLDSKTVILSTSNRLFYNSFKYRLNQMHVKYNRVITVSHLSDALPLLSDDNIVCLGYQQLNYLYISSDIVSIPLNDISLVHTVCIVKKRYQQLTSGAQRFWDYSLSWSREQDM